MRLKTAVLAAVACLALAVPSAAIAASPTQDAYGGVGGQQQGGNQPSSGNLGEPAAANVAGEEVTESSGTLPFTGLEVGLIALVGVGLLGGGIVLFRVSRQRTELQS